MLLSKSSSFAETEYTINQKCWIIDFFHILANPLCSALVLLSKFSLHMINLMLHLKVCETLTDDVSQYADWLSGLKNACTTEQ